MSLFQKHMAFKNPKRATQDNIDFVSQTLVTDQIHSIKINKRALLL